MKKSIKVLLQTLKSHSKVNLGMAAIKFLTNYMDKPMVREDLVKSIVRQGASIVRVI